MNNLFSIFDPSTGIFSLNWMALLLVLLMPSYYWMTSNKPLMMYSKVVHFLNLEVSALIPSKFPNSANLILIALFSFIIFMNLMGLLPYVFTPTSHISITLSMALPAWLGYNFWNMTHSFSKMTAHLAPKGTPLILVPLMVLIELVSNMIRPLTLSVRLAANMVAGHLLLTLISSPMPFMSSIIFLVSMISLIMLTLLELAVASIQAYVFTALSSLYVEEAKGP